MNKEGGNFLEKHIEKLVLVIVGLVCIWLLFSHVLFSPNIIEFEGKKFAPGNIDIYIKEKAENLRYAMEGAAKPKDAYKKQGDNFIVLFKSTVPDGDAAISWPIPSKVSTAASSDKKYSVPQVEKTGINEATVGHIRAVAYIPISEVTPENPYDGASVEPNDIDFVTIEAKYDIAQLYEMFHDSFASDKIREDWRDNTLATPIFAAVQLQRQELLSDGRWSNWQEVPRTKIESRKELFKIIEDTKELPAGGIKLRMLQFDNAEVRIDLLQPESYQFASTYKEWFPPSLHKEFVKYIDDLQAQERRETLEAKKQERETKLAERREKEKSKRESSAVIAGSSGDGGSSSMVTINMGGGAGRPAASTSKTGTSRTRDRSERDQQRRERPYSSTSKGSSGAISLNDIYDKLDDMLIRSNKRLDKMTEPIVFWANDDTVEAGKSYRYRIRLGVFNPIAGTGQFDKNSEQLKNNVILWSSFSDVTDVIEIPIRLHFFATDVQENTKTVTVQVSRYILDYWYSKEFAVRPGEEIGKITEYEPSEEEKGIIKTPQNVNYSVGAILVDVVSSNDWALSSGGLREKYYFDMLYSSGDIIGHMPIKSKYWPDKLQSLFNEIKKSEKEEKKPLRAWGEGIR